MHTRRVIHLDPTESSMPPEPLQAMLQFTGLDQWLHLGTALYGNTRFRMITSEQDNGPIDGYLAMHEISHPLFGNYLCSSPYGSYGGLGYLTPSARDALLEEVVSLVQTKNLHYGVVRFRDPQAEPPHRWIPDHSYCTYLLSLAQPLSSLFDSFTSDHRNHIRKSLKQGYTIKFGGRELLDDSYYALAKSMHELGTPFHSKRYFATMAEQFNHALHFVAMYGGEGTIIGGGVFLRHGTTITNLYANVLREYRRKYPGEFLYWSVIEHFRDGQTEFLDLGRSLVGSGNETFKLRWKAEKIPLCYWYTLGKAKEVPHMNQQNPRFRLAINTWKALPQKLTDTLGGYLIRGVA